MIKAAPSNVAGYCVGWEPPRWSFRLRSQLVQAPMHRDSMGGHRATFREVTIATGNLSPSISSGLGIDFDSTRHRAALRPNKSSATRGGAQIYQVVVATSSDRLRGAVRRLFILHVYQINARHLAFRTNLMTSQCPLCANKRRRSWMAAQSAGIVN